MCVVSFVSDGYGSGTKPGWPYTPPPQPPAPIVPWPQAAPVELPWTQESLDLLKEVLAKLKKLDTILGLPDCDDPKKAEWMKAVEKKVKQATSKAKKKKTKKA